MEGDYKIIQSHWRLAGLEDRKSVRIRQDLWVGGTYFVRFPVDMIHKWVDHGYIHLHKIQKLSFFPHLIQPWLSAAELELYVGESIIQDRYIETL